MTRKRFRKRPSASSRTLTAKSRKCSTPAKRFHSRPLHTKAQLDAAIKQVEAHQAARNIQAILASRYTVNGSSNTPKGSNGEKPTVSTSAWETCPFYSPGLGGKCQPHGLNTLGLCRKKECPISERLKMPVPPLDVTMTIQDGWIKVTRIRCDGQSIPFKVEVRRINT